MTQLNEAKFQLSLLTALRGVLPGVSLLLARMSAALAVALVPPFLEAAVNRVTERVLACRVAAPRAICRRSA